MAKTGAPYRNTNAVKHGGEAGIKALSANKPFTGLAAQAELNVRADLQTKGRAALIEDSAVRLTALEIIFYDALKAKIDAVQKGEKSIEELDGHVKRYGWFSTAALRAWAQVGEEERAGSPTLDYDQMVMSLLDENA